MKLYHVDRLNRLQEGENITLFNDYSLDGDYGCQICDFVRNLYPEGISEHGDRYLFDGQNVDWIKEAHLESMRLRLFPHSLSRMNLIDMLQVPGVAVTQYFAYQYWAGERSENPLLECLLPFPVTIGKKVN